MRELVDKEEDQEALPFGVVRRLIFASIAAGILGGILGTFAFVRYFPAAIPVDKRQVLLQENSSVIDVVQKVSPSVVSIRSERSVVGPFGFGRAQEGAGTGIILTRDGLIMTNKHVIEGASSFTVTTNDGKEFENAQVVAQDPFNDIAFLRVNANDLKPAELGNSSELKVGQRVVAIGNALGQFENSASTGIVSGLSRDIRASDGTSQGETLGNLIQTDAAINAGNSGGPLVNLEGQVIGVNTAIAATGQNIGFAIPINETMAQISSVKEQGRIVRPYLGVRYVAINQSFAADNNLPVQSGALITGQGENLAVLPDSPAAKAGLREGDIITKIGDKKIDKNNSLQSLIGRFKVGEKVSLTVIRDKREEKIEVTLEEAPSGP